MPNKFRWNPSAGSTGRYQDIRTGRFVSPKIVRSQLDSFIDSAQSPAKGLADQLRDGSISLADWETGMRRLIKNTHLSAIAEERGGWDNMTQGDYGRAGQIIREQYDYLHKFAEQIANGQQPLDGRFEVRSNLYVKAGRESFYKSQQAAAQRNGLTQVRSIRFPGDSCVECVALDGKWFDIGDPEYKLPGQRVCNKNCRCDEEYR